MQCYSSLTVVILRMILIQSHQTSRAFSRGTQIITVWCFDTMPHGKQRIEIKPTFISIFSLNRHFPQFASMPTKWFHIEVGNEIVFSVVFHIQPRFQAVVRAY